MPVSNPLSIPRTYADLRQSVLSVVFKGRRQIDRAWLLTYHETGRLIHEHLLLNKARANYGAQVFARLAEDTGTSSRSLHEFVQFYRCFPIVRAPAQLSWNHYRVLCQVPDPERRQRLLSLTVKRSWSSPQLEQEVRALAPAKQAAAEAAKDVTPPKLLTPRRGTPGVCQVITAGGVLVADLGFACYLDLPPDAGFAAGAFLQMDAAGRLSAAPEAGKADLFTYTAVILKVVDGDTLWVKIYLRPRQWVKQKLRLRDLDAPEMSTPEGRAAKRFVDGLLTERTVVTVCTTKPDKYDRYLADVFVPAEAGGEEAFLNNALLAAGHAVPKQAWEFGDWGE